MSRHRFLIFLIALFSGCSSSEEKASVFSDPHLVKIADFQDRRMTDSLLHYFNHENPLYRNEAVRAFGSVQDSAALDRIGKVLVLDTDTVVRKSAAFALGQIPGLHSKRLLLAGLVKEKSPFVLKEILEAYGKTTREWKNIQPKALHDTVKASSLAWSIYRAGLRDKTDTASNTIATTLLSSDQVYRTRLGAAHYFSRGAKNYEGAEAALRTAATGDPHPEVRMAAALALQKLPSDATLQVLKPLAVEDKDYRVRVNAIRALQAFPFSQTKDVLFSALNDKNVNVGISASLVIKANLDPNEWTKVSTLINDPMNWRIASNLYEGILSVSNNDLVKKEIQDKISASKNPYEKAALLSALQQDPGSHTFVATVLMEADTPVVRTAAASALVAMNKHKKFPASLRPAFAEFYKKAIGTGDPAVIGIIAEALSDPDLAYKSFIRDFSFLYSAKEKLELPRDNEALQPLEKAIAFAEGKPEPEPVSNEYNHPIDFEILRSLPPDPKATIKTTKGNIVIRLFPTEAPGSVANFVDLTRKNYFTQKFFHRVVPNFVIQTGCNRGDGWGSEDYSIRSEFTPRRYTTGSVGMASAGKDTEGTQWFITHSPTPHLDGRYTIFAEVISGMDVVHAIEVGDQILVVTLDQDQPK